MTAMAFRELLGQQPFQPFRFVMLGGKSYEIRNPRAALLTQKELFVGIDIADDGVPAGFKICPLLHIATIEPLGE